MSNIMLDLETMGNSGNSAIIAIGACFFSNGKVGEKFYKQVSLQSSVTAGLVMDTSTVLWWLKQSDEARSAFADNENAMCLAAALREFAEFIDTHGDRKKVRIWGNGAAFDNPILSNCYKAVGLDTPWEHRNDRCYRTIKSLYPNIKMKRVGTHHNALDDAISQAVHLMDILTY